MNNYVRYRNWWRKWSYDKAHDPGPFDACFKAHINRMSLYEVMETLEGFGEEDNDEYAPGSQPEKLMEELVLPDFPPPYIKYPTPSNPTPIVPLPFIPPTPPYKYDPLTHPKPWPAPFTPNPWPGVLSCSRCGISLDGVMGYVCSDRQCPTFVHTWSGTITGTISVGDTGPYFGGSSNIGSAK